MVKGLLNIQYLNISLKFCQTTPTIVIFVVVVFCYFSWCFTIQSTVFPSCFDVFQGRTSITYHADVHDTARIQCYASCNLCAVLLTFSVSNIYSKYRKGNQCDALCNLRTVLLTFPVLNIYSKYRKGIITKQMQFLKIPRNS